MPPSSVKERTRTVEDAIAQKDLRRIQRLSQLLDSSIRFPGTRFRFGLDGLIGLLPGIGDVVTALPSVYYLYIARRHGMGAGVYVRILANVGLDCLVGSIPLVGDAFDFVFKAHARNARLLQRKLERIQA